MAGFRIQARYEELEAAASQFAQEADKVQQLFNRIKQQSEQVHGSGWIGRAADKFLSEYEGHVVPRTQKLITALERSSHGIKQVAHVLADAEREANGLLGRFGG